MVLFALLASIWLLVKWEQSVMQTGYSLENTGMPSEEVYCSCLQCD